MNAKNDDGITALMMASMAGQTEIVGALLERGADVNAKSKSVWWDSFVISRTRGTPRDRKSLVG